MTRSRLALAIVAGLACFAAGIWAARFFAAPSAPGSAEPSRFAPAAPVEPHIMIDPASIKLLPDASLRLDLPPDFDASAP